VSAVNTGQCAIDMYKAYNNMNYLTYFYIPKSWTRHTEVCTFWLHCYPFGNTAWKLWDASNWLENGPLQPTSSK